MHKATAQKPDASEGTRIIFAWCEVIIPIPFPFPKGTSDRPRHTLAELDIGSAYVFRRWVSRGIARKKPSRARLNSTAGDPTAPATRITFLEFVTLFLLVLRYLDSCYGEGRR